MLKHDVEYTKIRTERILSVLKYIATLYKQAKESNSKINYPTKPPRKNADGEMVELEDEMADERENLMIEEFRKANSSTLSEFLTTMSSKIFQLHLDSVQYLE